MPYIDDILARATPELQQAIYFAFSTAEVEDWMKGNAEREWLMHIKTVEYLPQEQDFLSL